jgi:uncharacterized protein (TIGR03067 family)
MKKSRLLLAVLLFPLLGSGSPREYDDRTQMANVEGTWRLVRVVRAGTVGQDPEWELVFRADGTYSWMGPAQIGGTYKVDAGRAPAQIDLCATNDPRRAHRGIFRFDGDVLLIALFEPEDVRPQSFSDKNLKVLTLKRVKK